MRTWLARRIAFALAGLGLAAVVFATVGGAATKDTAPSSSSPPTIGGTAQVGQTLTATSGSWSGTTPMTFVYQWRRCPSGGTCSDIAGGTSQTYTAQTADVANSLRVQVTASNGVGSGQATSAPTSTVTAAPVATAPQNTAAPLITGTLSQGHTLTVSTGTWTGSAPITYGYQWQRCNPQGIKCAAITGAASSSYTLAAADTGNRLQVLLTAMNSAGSTQKYSNQTGQVGTTATGPANTAGPELSGTPTVGQTLAVSSGSWTGTAPISYAYQWQRCNAQGTNCAPIGGATAASYALTQADLGSRLQTLVTATNAGGSSSKYSNQSATVVAAGPAPGATIPASSVNLPDQLIIDRMQYPQGGHSRSVFAARFHVVDTAGHPVSGALVYTIGLPYGWVRYVPEQPTGQDGWTTFTIDPTAQMPRFTYLVMFVRARTPQGNLLAGASTRRLVQVRIRP